MTSMLDPCNPSIASTACCCVLCLIVLVQSAGSNTSYGCLPYVDYLKFVMLFIVIYFAYENVIKGQSLTCGTNAFPMWSSICCSIILSSVVLVGICARLRGGFLGNIGYVPMLCLFCLTICCVARLYKTGGPLSASFFDPTTITSFQM